MKPRITIWGFRNEYDRQLEGQPIASHAYIHAGYFRAFKALGYETQWLDDSTADLPFLFADSILFCMDTRMACLPVSADRRYITHNIGEEKLPGVPPEQITALQYWFKEAPGSSINDYTRWDGSTLYQPWATDLMPDEFPDDVVKSDTRVCNWVGSIWAEGEWGNASEVQQMIDALAKNRIKFEQVRCRDGEHHKQLIRESYIAPSLQSMWQVRKGYIPCRAFKNCSYGQPLATNSQTVHRLFGGMGAFGNTPAEMVEAAISLRESASYETMAIRCRELVKAKHTYLNRVKTLMEFVK